MKVGNILKTSFIGIILSAPVSSCKKSPLLKMDSDNISPSLTQKVNFISNQTTKILRDTTYKFFGYDTIEISYKNSSDIIKDMNIQAQKHSPKIQIGKHTENQIIPSQDGGFNIIPVWKKDYVSYYINSKAIVRSKNIYTRNKKDIYIPVEYYGRINPEVLKTK